MKIFNIDSFPEDLNGFFECLEKDTSKKDSDKRLQWLEDNHTLHKRVDIFYAVDGYEVTVLYDEECISPTVKGQTMAEAIDKLIEYQGKLGCGLCGI